MAREDLQKHTLNLFPGDYEKLRILFPSLGAGLIIRKLVHQFIEKTEAGLAELPKTETEL